MIQFDDIGKIGKKKPKLKGSKVISLQEPLNGKWHVFLEDVPSVNHMYFNLRDRPGVKILTKVGREFKQTAALLLKTACPLRDFEQKLVVEAIAHWPDRRRRDMNNYAKIICDSIEDAGIVKDDKVTLWREMDWMLDPGVQGFELTIYAKESV
ncbi:MAG: RusA family crossover junction endodeoxyribonuclease [Patescibacteria group bacterium]|nr:RusA family crossover junction endodeoxyribonuclease [Patescibacteria group bacterium]